MTALPRNPAEWWLAARVVVVLLAIRLALRLAQPLPKLLAALTPGQAQRKADWGAADRAARFIDALQRRRPATPGGSCLPRSLALYRFARQAGIPVRFHCGARRMHEGVTGHAWLTLDGQPYHEGAAAAGYAEMFSYP